MNLEWTIRQKYKNNIITDTYLLQSSFQKIIIRIFLKKKVFFQSKLYTSSKRTYLELFVE